MNAVIGMAHLALKTDLTAKQRDYLKKIQSSANSLLGIINDILDFSKIEAGKLDMEAVDFNLDDVLDNLANLVTVKAQEKENLEVLFAAAHDVPRYLVGDSLRLGQVLINLANNAVKFTDSGNLAATELQAATVELEKLIKGGQKKISPPEQLDQKFVELEKAIFIALQAVQILGSPAEEKTAAPSTGKLSAVPPELIKELVDRKSVV